MSNSILRRASALALAAFAFVAYAQDDVTMPEYVIDPADGAQVYEIDKIEISFYGRDVVLALPDMIFLEDAQGTAIDFVASVPQFGSDPALLIQPMAPITDPGDYKLIVGYGALKVDNTTLPEPITATWTVLKAADSWDGEVAIDPADGSELESIHSILFTFDDATEVIIDEAAAPSSFPQLTNKADGTVYKAMVFAKDNTLDVSLFATVTDPGEYELTLHKELIKVDGAPMARNIVVNYTIGGSTAAFDYTYSFDPADGANIGSQEAITISFAADGLKKIECNPYATSLDGSLPSLCDEAGASVPCTITYGNDNFSFVMTPYYPIEQPGKYTLTIPAGYVTLYNDNGDQEKNKAFSATYNVETTGIGSIAAPAGKSEIYKLDGSPASQPLHPGIYIINGKQTLIHK